MEWRLDHTNQLVGDDLIIWGGTCTSGRRVEGRDRDGGWWREGIETEDGGKRG